MKTAYYFFLCSMFLIPLILIGIYLKSDTDSWFSTSKLMRTVFYLLPIYIAASFKIVGPTEIGAILVFGKPIAEVRSGLVIAPLLISTLVKETCLIIQKELPAEPEKIWRGEEGESIPEGLFPPIRITFGPPTKDTESPNFIDDLDNPYDKQMTAEVTPVISWRIKDFLKFLQTIGSVENTTKQMEDVAVARFGTNFAQVTPAAAMKRLDEHSADLRNDIENRVKDWGVEVVSANIKPFGFSHSLNTSVIEVSRAEQGAKVTVISANAMKKKLELEGEGAANAKEKLLKAEANGEQAKLEGRAKGLEKVAQVAKTEEGKIALQQDVVKSGLEKSNHTIVPGGTFFEGLSSVQTILDKTKPKGGTNA